MQVIILFSIIAGILGTLIGGILGVFFGNKTQKTVSLILSLACGIMISIAVFDLIPHAYEYSGGIVSSLGLLLGFLIVFVFGYFLDIISMKNGKIKTHDNLESLHHQDKLLTNKEKKEKFIYAGIVMIFAISLHNIPEGMAIGASGVISVQLSFTLTLLLMLHNIPEGMAIATPLSIGGISKKKIYFLIILVGTTTVIGAFIGYLLGELGGVFAGLSLSFAGGAMLYVSICEIMPQSILMQKGRLPTIFVMIGIFVGYIVHVVF